MTIQYDEYGYPIQDGYWEVVLMGQGGIANKYNYVNFRITEHVAGITIEDHNRTYKTVIPWHRIVRVTETLNSDEFVEAVEAFQLACEHNFLHQPHHLLRPCPGKVCTKCHLSEPVSEEDEIHTES